MNVGEETFPEII